MNDRPSAPEGLQLIQGLVNTRDVEDGTDTLDTAEGRRPFGLTAADVPAAKLLREALRAACLAHAGQGTAYALDALLADVALRVVVDPRGAAMIAATADGLLPRVAESVARASLDGSWQRLKACEAETCQWAYYDRSPAGRRRWCSMSVCGARSKMRAYRARRA
ncbi:CGNR zinc finger domain-containing protein [Streptomyces sp. NBC_01497]|uniref:CGNR zinc finger domain-containing protein n=1 Tax=Streptomyces sp. NBC_01497 TaxID=2903885 RepID=UPI002E35BEAD|nr:CGNR zinc finger domain-containing protein [Streptomyces sp. NBC_01497]